MKGPAKSVLMASVLGAALNVSAVDEPLAVQTDTPASLTPPPAGEASETPALSPGPPSNRLSLHAPDSSELRELRRLTGSYVSPWFLEVLKLTRSGLEDAVVEAFIQTAGTFNLTPKLLIYARNAGISPEVIVAMMNHDAAMAQGLLPPPNAPPLTAIPRLPPLTSSAELRATAPARPQDSESEFVDPLFSSHEDSHSSLEDLYIEPPLLEESSPVREPYPVRLPDTIRIFHGTWRQPNMQVIWMFPGARPR